MVIPLCAAERWPLPSVRRRVRRRHRRCLDLPADQPLHTPAALYKERWRGAKVPAGMKEGRLTGPLLGSETA